jgi:soluble lytic murein transglycosylase-like protein
MRVLRPIATLLILFSTVFAAKGFAAEVAELRNGFTIPHRSREMRDGLVRLYMDEAKTSFVDLPAEEIARYSSQPNPEPTPSRETLSLTTPSSATPAKSTDQIVREASETQGVDSDFLGSVIRQESAGNAHAVSPAGARGLMQLMPSTAQELGVTDSFSPEQNVHGGARYLRTLLERYHGDAIKALAAYNAGPGAVDRYRGVPPYRETRMYVQRVVRDYNSKKQSGGKYRQKSGEVHESSGGPATTSYLARKGCAGATGKGGRIKDVSLMADRAALEPR